MNIYLVSVPTWDYDEYDAMVVTARSPERARQEAAAKARYQVNDFLKAEVKYLGKARAYAEPGVELGSFNAG